MTDDEPTTCPTQEEAIAAAMEESEPGDVIAIHEAACSVTADVDCDCTPLIITVGEMGSN